MSGHEVAIYFRMQSLLEKTTKQNSPLSDPLSCLSFQQPQQLLRTQDLMKTPTCRYTAVKLLRRASDEQTIANINNRTWSKGTKGTRANKWSTRDQITFFISSHLSTLTSEVVGAPEMTMQQYLSTLPCLPLHSGNRQTPSCPFLDVIFPSLLLSSSPSCSFHYPLQHCLRHARGS